jgi:hypothetical protein
MEKELEKFIHEKHGVPGSMEVISDNGKTVMVKADYGDDEIITMTINRRKGNKGNYRIVVEG